jgi:hypothetical protein
VELVQQIDNLINRHALAVVAFEVVEVVWRRFIVFLGRHGQDHGVEHGQLLVAELVPHRHQPRRRRFRREKLVQLEVRFGVGDGRDHALVGLLDGIGKAQGHIDDPVLGDAVELVLQ